MFTWHKQDVVKVMTYFRVVLGLLEITHHFASLRSIRNKAKIIPTWFSVRRVCCFQNVL